MAYDDSDMSLSVNVDIDTMSVVKINGCRFIKQKIQNKPKVEHRTVYANSLISLKIYDSVIVISKGSKWELKVRNGMYELSNGKLNFYISKDEVNKYFSSYNPNDTFSWENARFNGEFD